MSDLKTAVAKIKAGDKEGGKQILIDVLRADPRNENAWLWLSVTMDDPDKRRECLERVLKINPNNPHALKRLQKTQMEPSQQPTRADREAQPAYLVEQPAQPKKPPRPEQPARSKKPARPARSAAQATPPSRSFAQLVKVWMNFYRLTEDIFKIEIRLANTEDTLLGLLVMMLASLLGSMMMWFAASSLIHRMQVEIPIFGNAMLALFFFSLIVIPLGFYVGVGVRYLGARLFGGRGDYATQAYLQSLVVVPVTVIMQVLAIAGRIPCLGIFFSLATIGLVIFEFVLIVRSIKVLHQLQTWQAVIATLLPTILSMILMACIGVFLVSLFAQTQDSPFAYHLFVAIGSQI